MIAPYPIIDKRFTLFRYKKSKFPKRRHAATVIAIRHLQDKSAIVRKFAIRMLTTLISTHPYSMYGGELNLEDWNYRLDTLKKEIEVKFECLWRKG